MTPQEIREARISLAMTQNDLAAALRVSIRTIIRWEQGHVAAPPYLALALTELERQQKDAA